MLAKNEGSYRLWATRPYSIMHVQGFVEHAIDHGCKAEYVVAIGEDKAEYIVEKDSFEKACHAIGVEFIEDHDTLLGEYDARRSELVRYAGLLSEKAGHIPDAELKKMYLDYWNISRAFQPYMMFPHYAEQELEPAIKALYPDEFYIISGLEKPLEHMKMNYALFTSPIEDVVHDYGYLAIYAMTEKTFSKEHFEAIKRDLDFKKVKESMEELESNRVAYEGLRKKIKKEDLLRCDVLHKFVFIRTDRIDAWKMHNHLLYRFAEYVAQKIDRRLGTKEGSMLSRDEVITILEEEPGVTYEELLRRGKREDIMTIFTKGGVRFTANEQEISQAKSLIAQHQADNASIKGVSACKGVVEGRAIVFLKRSDISDTDDGYILVCPHTSPQDVPFMKRAKAIITDEGGITSHAAIVSRELNVPCIVGAKIATKILKTGDVVRVDAEKGIVTKLN